MRLLICVVAVAIAVGGCGDDDGPAAPAANPDQPVQAPAGVTPPAGTPATPARCRRVSRRLEGRTLVAARRLAERAGCALRVVVEDGRSLPVTEDYSPTRINVHVEDGRVTELAGRF